MPSAAVSLEWVRAEQEEQPLCPWVLGKEPGCSRLFVLELLQSHDAGAPCGTATDAVWRDSVKLCQFQWGKQTQQRYAVGHARMPNISLCGMLQELEELFVAYLAVCGNWPLGIWGRCSTYRTAFPTSRNSTGNSVVFFKLAPAYTETREFQFCMYL